MIGVIARIRDSPGRTRGESQLSFSANATKAWQLFQKKNPGSE